MKRLAVASVLVLAAATIVYAQEKKPDPNGTWKWMQARGGQTVEATLKLKVDGDKVSGTVSQPGQNNDPRETPITDAKYKDGELAFTVTVEFNDQKRTRKYSGKVSGDTIKGKIELITSDSKPQVSDWDAKREPEKKK